MAEACHSTYVYARALAAPGAIWNERSRNDVTRIPWRLGALLAILILGGLAAAAAVVEPPAATADWQASFARHGRLVRLPDGRRINLRCSGQGAPTVLLESGFGASSSAWGKVQPQVAAVTRVCSYDRAGYGFSDVGPLLRDGAAIARDLDQALKAANIRGPFIVVGHSAGGLYERLFAARRLHQVVGLVFVDSSVEHQDRRMAQVFGPGAGSVAGIHRRVTRCLEATTAHRVSSVAEDYAACVPKTGGLHAQMVALRPGTWRSQLSEIDTLFNDTSDQVERTGGLLKDIPAIVLTASPTGVAAGPEDPGAAVWQGMHRDLARGFLKGDQRLVKSGHLMMNERPEVVAGAILELVAANRPRPSPTTP